jgi:hypothetical protein
MNVVGSSGSEMSGWNSFVSRVSVTAERTKKKLLTIQPARTGFPPQIGGFVQEGGKISEPDVFRI